MAVACFIGAGFSGLLCVVMLLASLAGGLSDAAGGTIGGRALSLTYIAMAVMYVIAGRFLTRYATAIKLLRTSMDARFLEEALGHQKSFWKFTGIVTIVALSCVVLLFGLAVIVGAVAAIAARG